MGTDGAAQFKHCLQERSNLPPAIQGPAGAKSQTALFALPSALRMLLLPKSSGAKAATIRGTERPETSEVHCPPRLRRRNREANAKESAEGEEGNGG
uniref:Uncharacterized protein n=1 Tax=Trichuris muris TaxID=70415 RepID=A0A5S6QPQ1_TRIMR